MKKVFVKFFAKFFEVFAKFFKVFASFLRFSRAFRGFRIHSDPLGCIRMHSEAIGSVWTFSKIFEIFWIFESFFNVSGRNFYKRLFSRHNTSTSICFHREADFASEVLGHLEFVNVDNPTGIAFRTVFP